jgi:hypothetical protein
VEQLQATTKNGSVPMHVAAQYNPSAEVVRCLVELGGVEQLQATSKNGCVPMHFAARSNPSAEVVRCLLGKGCDRSPSTHRGATPLHLAISHNQEDQVALALVEAGAETAGVRLSASLHCAAMNVSLVSVLSSYFADNVTPVMAAVRCPAVILRACVAMHGYLACQTTMHVCISFGNHAQRMSWCACAGTPSCVGLLPARPPCY